MYETLVIEQAGAIARLWLNRPDKLNPLSLQTLQELTAAARALDANPKVRVIIVGGRGRSFSAGADLTGFPGPGEPGAREAADAGRIMPDAVATRPALPVQATKRHVDAVTATQVGLSRSWSEADSLLAGLLDEECEAARGRYLAARRKPA
jgi:1,4-dihydroxy-2-naphthoyl-CoA synthase